MRRRILLADDSVTIQKVIELTFMDEDYDVKAVSNGDEAVAALPDVKPDFVIADVHMPGANGYEVCRRSKEIQPGVPVLLLVGTFEPFDEGQARAAGADSFLKKPFDSQELLQRVQELVSSRPGTAAAAAAPAAPEMDFGAALPPLDLGELEPEPPAETDWGSFQLEPETAPAFAAPEPFEPFPAAAPAPRLDSPFLEEEAPFILEDDRSAASFQVEESAVLPAGEPMFELDSPADLPPLEERPALGGIELDNTPTTPFPAMRPAAGFAAPWSSGEATAPEERLGVPASAVPLVDSLEETEARIEAPPPPSLSASHEPESAPAWSSPLELEPAPWSPAEPAPWNPPPTPPTPTPAAEAPQPPVAAAAAPPLAVGSVSDLSAASSHGGNGRLSDEDVDRIARRVVELMGDKAVRDVAWEVIPDLAEVVIRSRLRELESQVENPAE